MYLYEFQAKELLSRFGVAVPRGRIAASAGDAERIARRLGFNAYVVKAQIRSGDRNASGGIQFAGSALEAGVLARGLLGRRLVTPQTGSQGELVRWAYIEERIDAPRHLYAAITVDRNAGALTLLSGAQGGDDIEARIARDPGAIVSTRLQLAGSGVTGDFEGAARAIGLAGLAAEQAGALFERLARAAVALDATLVEVNPLALTSDGRLVALDAKITIDDNALARQHDLAGLHEATAAEDGDPTELAAQAHQLNYQFMDGNIGVVVNGAGLALATHDALRDAGGAPANFMDIRTTASSLDIAFGVGLILANRAVDRILVNVHGGGMQRCDTIADGIGIAVARVRRVPRLVVRFAGNNAAFGLERLASYGVPFETADTIGNAIAAVVAADRREAA